jgi:hypothetical protein
MSQRHFGLVTLGVVCALIGCSAKEPPTPEPSVKGALAAPVNEAPVTSIPASAASGFARWDVYTSEQNSVRLVGRDAEGHLKDAVTLAGSQGKDGFFLGALDFAKEKDSPLTWDAVVRAYLADADAFAAARPEATLHPTHDPIVTRTELIDSYCQGLTNAFGAAIAGTGGPYPSQPGWRYNGTDPACLNDDGDGEIYDGRIGGYVEAYGCPAFEKTKVELDHYLVQPVLGPLTDYWTCKPPP